MRLLATVTVLLTLAGCARHGIETPQSGAEVAQRDPFAKGE